MNTNIFTSFFKDLWRNRLSRYSLLIGLLGLILFLALPVGSKYFLRQWLLNNGADTATIGKIRINPFTGSFSLGDVSVTRDGQTVFSNSTVEVDLGLRALFDREALLQKATLTDTVVEIERYDDGTLRVGSYRTSPQDEQPVGRDDVPWVFRAKEVGFSDVLIRYLGSGYHLNLFIEEGTAQRFTTDPQGRTGSLDIEGTLNEAPLALHLSVLKVNPDLHLEGRLDCSGFPLSDLRGVFGGQLTELSGSLRAETEFAIKYGEAGLTTTFRGKIGLVDIDVGGNGWTGTGELALDGGLGYASTEPSGPRVAVDGLLIARPVSFAMPEKQLHLDRTEATHKGQTSIVLGDAVSVQSDAEFSVAGADFRLAETAVTGSGTWSGTVELDSGKNEEPLRLETDGGLELQELLLSMPGTVELKGERLTIKGRTKVVAGDAVTVHSDAEISLAGADVRLAETAVTAGLGTWSGTVELDSGKNEEPLRLKTDGGLELQELLLAMPGTVELNGKRLTTKGTTSVIAGDALKTGFSGNIGLTAASMRTGSLSVEGEEFAWQGDVAYAASPQTLSLAGTAEAGRPVVTLPASDLQVAANTLSLDADAALDFGEGPIYTGTSGMTAAGIRVARGESILAEIGRGAVDRFAGDNGTLSVDAITAEAVELPRSEVLPVRVTFDRGGLRGATADKSLANIDFLELTVQNPSVADEGGEIIAAAAALALANGSVQDLGAVEAENLRLDSGAFLNGLGGNPQQPLATVAEARGFPFSWSESEGTRIGELRADNLVVRYQKSQESQVPPSEKEPDDGKSEPIPLRIGSMSVSGDSALHYHDPTLDPSFQTTVAVSSLNLSDIDLNNPEESMSFTLEAMVDKYAPLSLSGSMAPLASPFRLKLDGNLQNYSLHSLSPYAVQAVGIALQSGQLDLTTDLSVTGEQLSSDNRLKIKNIEISRRNAERARSLEAGLPVPLEMAIDMLSDRQGVITVTVPIHGTISDLQVGIQGVVVTALNKAISQGIVPALAYTALGPTGALVYLGMKIGGALLDTDLPSLQFAPDRSDLSAGQRTILDKVGQSLQQKMQDGSTTYSICPQVVPGETAGGGGVSALTDEERRKELYRLGEQRAQAVKQYLVQNFNLDPDRLFICNPTLNYGESARGTVDFRK